MRFLNLNLKNLLTCDIIQTSIIMFKNYLSIIAILCVCFTSFSQVNKNTDLDILSLKYAKSSFDELQEFFSLPNDAYQPEQIEPNVKWCENAFAKRGFKTQRLETETVPLLLASRNYPNAKKTVLVYLQVDGQPVDVTKWQQSDPLQENQCWASHPTKYRTASCLQ